MNLLYIFVNELHKNNNLKYTLLEEIFVKTATFFVCDHISFIFVKLISMFRMYTRNYCV